jgi:hypothetical protein
MQFFKIAVLGDSMFERWGKGCPALEEELKRQYPRGEFIVENHGVEGSRAGNGLWRVTNDYRVGDELRTALCSFDPDITVVESFAYSNRIDGPEGLSEYRDILRRIVEEIRATTKSKVLFCLALPPHRERFLENSALFLNTSRATRQRFADDVKLYLEEARRIAQDEEWPLADAVAEIEKRIASGEKMRRVIDQNDNWHPSPYGLIVQAQVIVRAVDTHRMIDEKNER